MVERGLMGSRGGGGKGAGGGGDGGSGAAEQQQRTALSGGTQPLKRTCTMHCIISMQPTAGVSQP